MQIRIFWIFHKKHLFLNEMSGYFYHGGYLITGIKKSDYVAGKILCNDPVTVVTIKPFWQHLEFALNRLVGI